MSRLTRWALLTIAAMLGVTIAAYVAVVSAPAATLATAAAGEAVRQHHNPADPADASEAPPMAGQPTSPTSSDWLAAHAVDRPLKISTRWSPIKDLASPPLTRQVEAPSQPPGKPGQAAESPGDPKEPGVPATQQPELPAFAVEPESAPPRRPAPPAALPTDRDTTQPPAAALPPPVIEPLPQPGKFGITPVPGEGDDRLKFFFKDTDIRDVLAGISEQAGLNILPSKSVQGNVSASLNGVTVETALEAILRSTGYVARREGPFIYVGTPQDFDAMAQTADTVGTRIYRPNYVTSAELVALITPILTPQIGKAVPSSPSKVDIAADDSKAGGNDFAGADAVLVQDYEAVLSAIDQIVSEIDQRPAQVGIEAMILSVRLNDTNQFGVDFQFLRNKGHLKVGSGSAMQDLAQVTFNNGLKFAFLDSNLGAFLNCLESIGDTNVIANPKLMVLNKHRAEILIGSQLGYVSTSQTETSTTQSVNFLEVGAQLRLRPFIANDGLIRMEIHPELSTGTVRVEGGFTLPDKDVTQVTTNIMVRDGYTVVIGGLMREDLNTTTNQIPVVGNLPVIGPLFRNKIEEIEKREILVLVTPRIMHEPAMYYEGEQGAGEFHRRQALYQDKMSPLGKRHLGRKFFRLAQEAWACGDSQGALKQVSMSLQFDPLNRAAIDLRSDIWAGRHDGDHSGGTDVPVEMLPLEALDGHQISPFILDQLEQPGPTGQWVPPTSSAPIDPRRANELLNSTP